MVCLASLGLPTTLVEEIGLKIVVGDSDCINNLRFRKIHLELVAQKLWPLMQPHLEGDYDRTSIRLQIVTRCPSKHV
jgi:hypothetical protein